MQGKGDEEYFSQQRIPWKAKITCRQSSTCPSEEMLFRDKVWRVYQDTVYRANLKIAQRKGLTFYQTKLNAIIFYNTFPPFIIEKTIIKKTGEVVQDQTYKSPRSPQ